MFSLLSFITANIEILYEERYFIHTKSLSYTSVADQLLELKQNFQA